MCRRAAGLAVVVLKGVAEAAAGTVAVAVAIASSGSGRGRAQDVSRKLRLKKTERMFFAE
jgi:hypothetical protein